MKNFADSYIKRNNLLPKISESPNKDLNIIVVIPCINEPLLEKTLLSLKNCQKPKSAVELIVVINSAENSSNLIKAQNRKTLVETEKWIKNNSSDQLKYRIIFVENIPKKIAGAGYARKIGMDEAILRFSELENENGIIASFDADSTCQENYFVEIEKIHENEKTNVCTIFFEHDIEGEDFPQDVYDAIIEYELYLRYYKNALNYINFPYSFQTVGSSFTVRAWVYTKQGGMNRRQAGEDFYFLHKVFPLGNVQELNTTTVFPSPRPSDRVPFGTGKAVQKYLEAEKKELLTYNFNAFIHLKSFFDRINELYKIDLNIYNLLLKNLPKPVSNFLQSIDFFLNLKEINDNSSSLKSFKKRFFNTFNAFMILKYLNFVHEHFYEKIPVNTTAKHLLSETKQNSIESYTNKNLLLFFRKFDRFV